jgi:hypothetical protein
MKLNEILIERNCPSCKSSERTIAFRLLKSQFLYNNPTHNLSWFEKLNIPDDHKFPFVRCSHCGFVYSQFRLNDEYNFSFYNTGINVDSSKEKAFKKAKRIKQVEIWLNLLKNSPDKSSLKVLDFGGGWGDFLAIAKSYGVEVFGLEFDERKIEFAGSNGIPLHKMEFIDRNAPYDIFMCNQVMEHLDDPKRALQHLRSLLVKDAVGFVGVPNFNTKYLTENITLINRGGIPPKEINPFGHLNYFSPETFSKMLKECQFQVFTPEIKKKPAGLLSSIKRSLSTPKAKAELNSTLLYVKAV